MSKIWKRGDKLTIADLNRFENGSSSNDDGDKFVVTIIENDGTWTADKTIAEIIEAHNTGKFCIAIATTNMGEFPVNIEMGLVISGNSSDSSIVMFSSIVEGEQWSESVIITGFKDGNNDVWFVDKHVLSDLPSYSSDDNGKVLTIVNGQPEWITP